MTPDELRERLQDLCPHPIRLKIHDNKSTYAAARKEKGGVVHLAIHRLFLHASTPVLQALVRFSLCPDRQSRATIRQMAHLFFTRIEPPLPDMSLSDAKGSRVDLQVIYDELNKKFFDCAVQIPVAWFEAPRYRYYRHVTYGSFDRTRPLIRINRLLDYPEVPLPFVEFIVYHEMLHVVCEPQLDACGRLRVHTAEFRRRESLHPYYSQAREWEKKSLKFFKGCHVRT
jgi:hypothetical protein